MYSREEVSDYYDIMTSSYMEYGGPAQGWHYGLWSESTDSLQAAVAQGTVYLTEDLRLEPGMTVLDLGCGVGGLGLHLAANHGVRVVGVTLNARHCEIARGLAADRGLSSLLEFRHADFMDAPFEKEAYDYVFNHETFCYVSDVRTFLTRVKDALKPGGRWRALEGLCAQDASGEDARRRHEAAQRGWRMAPLQTVDSLERAAIEVGLEWESLRDMTQAASPTANMFVAMAAMVRQGNVPPGALPTDPRELEIKLAHIGAGEAFSEGLLAGDFRYARVTAGKPGAGIADGSTPLGTTAQ